MTRTLRSGPRWGLAGRVFRVPVILGVLGPGLIAANAGNDAGGIATYSSIGATYGYSLLWALVLITVGLAIVQEMAGRIGAVTGKGYSEVVRENFGLRMTTLVMVTLLVANAGLVVSEFAGIGAAGELFGLPRAVVVPLAALAVWALVTRGSYARIEKAFLAMTLVFLAYPVAAILEHPGWDQVGRSLVRPSVHWDAPYLTMFIALVGTTLTPYMQVYLQSAVADGGRAEPRRVRIDAYTGAVFSDLIAAFIVIATGATLFVVGHRVETAADAPAALRPVAGPYATFLFAGGLFGASMLAASVLPLATAYTVTEAFGFERGQSKTFEEAPTFLGLFTGLVVLGAAVPLLPGIDVIKLLISVQVLNGLILPLVLVTILRIASDPVIMGEHRNGRAYNVLAAAITGFVVLLSTAYLVITVHGLARRLFRG